MQTIQAPLIPWVLSQTEPEVGGDPAPSCPSMSRYLQVCGQSGGFSEPVLLCVLTLVRRGTRSPFTEKGLFQTFTAALVLLRRQVTKSSNDILLSTVWGKPLSHSILVNSETHPEAAHSCHRHQARVAQVESEYLT